jgi:Zn-dependent protease
MFDNQSTSFTIRGYTIHLTTGFFLTGFFLLWGFSKNPVVLLCAVLVELLIFFAHEAGHALVLRRFGIPTTMVFHGLGGTTIPLTEMRLSGRRQILVSAAGPALGLLAAALFYAGGHALIDVDGLPFSDEVLSILFFGWRCGLIVNLFNLLPIYPMDGGRILDELLIKIVPRRAPLVTPTLGLLLALALMVWALRIRSIWTAFIMVQFVISNFTQLRSVLRSSGPGQPDP